MNTSIITEQDFSDRDFKKESFKSKSSNNTKCETRWTKQMNEGTFILVLNGKDLYLPKFEPKDKNKEDFYNQCYSSGIPMEKIVSLEELECYIKWIQDNFK